jgi:23S rRNA pseudouridine2605 synthase
MLQRVQKIIASAGICSRRKAEKLIEHGKVKVNGKLISIGSKADPFSDNITVEGNKVKQPGRIYIAFNKPPDCLTTLHDPKGRRTILYYVKLKERVIPVGRLDFKTQGLLLLTNDGDFANRIMHPRYEIEKNYMVFLDRKFDASDVSKVNKGINLEEVKTRSARVSYASPTKDVINITLHEGQNRVVRRMMSHLGYKVKKLIRTRIGNVKLGSLRQGSIRNLSKKELIGLVN